MSKIEQEKAQDMGLIASNGFDLTGMALVVGALVPAGDGLRPIWQPGRAVWHALRVAPQREDQAEAWLRRRGVYAFHPVTMHRVRRMGRVRDYARRYLPGYVFARFPGPAMVHCIIGYGHILGAICTSSGVWGELREADLRALHRMRYIDAETRAARKAARNVVSAALGVAAGEAALFRAGPFAGLECEVVELTADGGARVRINIFGAMVAAQVSAADMVHGRKLP